MDKIEKIYFVDQKCREKEFEIESSEFWALVWLQELKGSVSESKSTSENKNQLALLLQSAGLVKVRKLWFAGDRERLTLMHPVIKLKSVVGVSEVLFGQFSVFVMRFNPVKELRSIFLVFGISGLVRFEAFVVPFFFLRERPLGHRHRDNGRDNCLQKRHSNIYKLIRFFGRMFWSSRYRFRPMAAAITMVNLT